MTDKNSEKEERHKKKMQKQKQSIDATIASAVKEQGVVVLLTGDGKGKTSSAFGMVLRALGYGYRVGVVQFIKGEQLSGEELYLKNELPEVDFYQMGTGFTWDTQDRSGDIAAAEKTWAVVEPMLKDERYHLVILDEITYMLSFKYLDEDRIINAIKARPKNQSVVLTGRGGGSAIRDIADTVSEVKDIKHAYHSGIKARKGVDF
ncbi:cob(I)yrinic acid a,c-diamide adenosyltransferase [Porticoccaceae bacterium]|jgi:cob(I)alamin adenosyltransferase|nr:cob(I)yrinic acid a,c-diamide adenosyltransferase [Porticoccaceae bacterium]MDA7769392.1 cob(I)yrinic acid a,c-diamide adenosyltransferase [Porticoccaceae bacterium]MDA8599267.1 cob(I)yrinic acid a,c-diamide adenosyltransferase [Porticoccaceae bacterium]MDA8878496.1 cob(I)yrinic acid a,c-diamide adenosyltransferase [Porticoccaceae bacterium]MDB2396024.1 cob(I)yrinic acid a,c-diamide adenosyltransferase [Porticoccaceae bacterium]|tara:strand:+ start:195 stop:809 length:615 start_codon:yes stop_codon:yes gene_type:complete